MVTSIAFKANQIVQGDSDGSLSMWDLKARSSKQVNTNRGAIRYLRFAPGKTNLKLIILYADGLDIANLKQVSDFFPPPISKYYFLKSIILFSLSYVEHLRENFSFEMGSRKWSNCGCRLGER